MGCSNSRTEADPVPAAKTDEAQLPTLLTSRANSKGKAEACNLAKRVEMLFFRLDLDDNGKLDKAELTALSQCNGMGEVLGEVLHRSCNAYTDGKISLVEWKAMFAKEAAGSEQRKNELVSWFEQMATAKESSQWKSQQDVCDFSSETEQKTSVQQANPIGILFRRLDIVGTGSLDKLELIALSDRACIGVAAGDALRVSCNSNEDGKVTLEEWKAMFEKECAKSEQGYDELLQSFEQMASVQEEERSEYLLRGLGIEPTTPFNGVPLECWKDLFAKEAAKYHWHADMS